jgi:hypothetical protein
MLPNGDVVYPVLINGVRTLPVDLEIGDNNFWIIAYPSDDDCEPVKSDITIEYSPDNILTTCTETNLTPTVVELNNGDFIVTCEGDNVEEFGVWVTVPGSTTPVLTML